ncbi:hypothetical protein DMN91_011828 [Ooceraea biroi]|uniref:Uncharacterized protein n=1 Tax=Ooceraea biroi TaxID=2015173 RepID=A0A3L8D6M1_OOCBI|nr:hypothetical protein DMN91_011828 [Ooceraea biroi]
MICLAVDVLSACNIQRFPFFPNFSICQALVSFYIICHPHLSVALSARCDFHDGRRGEKARCDLLLSGSTTDPLISHIVHRKENRRRLYDCRHARIHLSHRPGFAPADPVSESPLED